VAEFKQETKQVILMAQGENALKSRFCLCTWRQRWYSTRL